MQSGSFALSPDEVKETSPSHLHFIYLRRAEVALDAVACLIDCLYKNHLRSLNINLSKSILNPKKIAITKNSKTINIIQFCLFLLFENSAILLIENLNQKGIYKKSINCLFIFIWMSS